MALYEKTRAKKLIADQKDIRRVTVETLSKMAQIIGRTLGPGGRAVLIERDKEGLSPLITKDGVTVAKSLGVENAEENLVIEAAKEICTNTGKTAGDGTTTAIVLADAMVQSGTQFLNANPKFNPQRLVNELKDIYDRIIVPYLKENAIKVSTKEQLINVATISSNGDRKIAQSVVEAVTSAGEDGQVLIFESQDSEMRVEMSEGYIVISGLKDVGSLGPAFINDRAGQQVKMDKGIVFLYDGSMNDLKVPGFIQEVISETNQYDGTPIIVMAHSFSDAIIDRFVKTTKGGVTVVPVKTPHQMFANSQTSFLYDMAAYTGAKVYDPTNVEEFRDDDKDDGFGFFDTARINLYETFISCTTDSAKIESRILELKAICDSAPSDWDKSHIRASISKLQGGVSTILVGGKSELEIREKKARVEDAVEAVRSAIAEGIIPGGCSVHMLLTHKIESHPDFKPSWQIMVDTLLAPFSLLLANCGEEAAEVWPMIKEFVAISDGLPTKVFDALEHKVVDPFEAGIIEPAKVCRVAVGNALSVASLLITLGGIVVVPRNVGLETQLEMSKDAFRQMMNSNTGSVGQE